VKPGPLWDASPVLEGSVNRDSKIAFYVPLRCSELHTPVLAGPAGLPAGCRRLAIILVDQQGGASHLSRDPAALRFRGETDDPPLGLHDYYRKALRPIGHPMGFIGRFLAHSRHLSAQTDREALCLTPGGSSSSYLSGRCRMRRNATIVWLPAAGGNAAGCPQ